MALDLDFYLPLKIGNLAERLAVTGRSAYADLGVSGGLVRMLLVLDARPGSTPSELARIVLVDKALVSRTLKTLEARGLTRTTQTGKRSRIWLSDAGVALKDTLTPIALDRQAQLLAGFSADETATLVDLLRRLMRNLDKS